MDTTEQLHFHFSLSCIGEGNGNPLQCSCLENPRDREAWWATVYWVAQSRTRLKRLSSSSSSSSSSESASHGHGQSRAKSESGEAKRSCLAQLCLAQSFAKSYFTPLPSFNLSPHSNQTDILKRADFPSYLTPSSGSPQGLTCTRSRDVCLPQGTGWPLKKLAFL